MLKNISNESLSRDGTIGYTVGGLLYESIKPQQELCREGFDVETVELPSLSTNTAADVFRLGKEGLHSPILT